jgi:hypothetical protein
MSLMGQLLKRKRQPILLKSRLAASNGRFPQVGGSRNGRLLSRIEIDRALSRKKRSK